MPLLLFVLAVSACIIVHEFGHYAAARFSGTGVPEFSVGLGPVLFGFDSKNTRWNLRLFPVGGYVKLATSADSGSGNAERSPSGRTKYFDDASASRKVFILFSGAAMNFLFSGLLVLSASMYSGVPEYGSSAVGYVLEKSSARDAGILPGDEIISLNGSPVSSWDDVSDVLLEFRKKVPWGEFFEVNAELLRGGELFTVRAKGENLPGAPILGVKPIRVKKNFAGTLVSLVSRIPRVFEKTADAFSSLFNGTSENGASGVFSLGAASGNSFDAGFETFVFFIAALSLSVGVMNLLPVPGLDGWWILIALLEGARGRAFSEKWKRAATVAGLSFLAGLMVLAAGNDLAWMIVKK